VYIRYLKHIRGLIKISLGVSSLGLFHSVSELSLSIPSQEIGLGNVSKMTYVVSSGT